MAELVKKTAVICLTEEEFHETVGFRHVVGVHEFFHVTATANLLSIDFITNVIYRQSAKELIEFEELSNLVNEKGVAQRWQ